MSIQYLQDKQLDDIIKENKKVLVEFFATWCGACDMMAPIFEESVAKYSAFKVVKVDVDLCPITSVQHGVSSMPTVQLFIYGKKVTEFVGASKEKLDILLETYDKF